MRTILKALRHAVLAVSFCGVLAPLEASAGTISLGEAGNYAVLGLNIPVGSGTGTDVNLSNVQVTGNIGISRGGSMENMAPSSITGNVYVDPNVAANKVQTGPGTFHGSLAVTASSGIGSVARANSDALAASAAAEALVANYTTGNVTTSTTFDAGSLGHDAFGQTVVDINGAINLNDVNITLKGSSTDVFIVNVSGDLALVGTASILLDGGVSANHVLFNFTGGSTGTFDTHVGDTLNGTYLAPGYDLNLDGIWNGALIGGPIKIGLLSGAKVNGNPFTPVVGGTDSPPSAPLPGTALAGAALLAAVAAAARRPGLAQAARLA